MAFDFIDIIIIIAAPEPLNCAQVIKVKQSSLISNNVFTS